MIQEINSSDWPAFCRRVSEQQTGAMAKLEVLEANGAKTERVASATFQSMLFDKTDSCNDSITLRLRTDREIVYEIIEPTRITLHPSGAPGNFNPLQIEAESGVTFITLHPAIRAQTLKELKIIPHGA
jgi:hypothetical protein